MCSATSSAGYINSGGKSLLKYCMLCSNELNEENISGDAQKLYKLCCRYLHSTLTQENASIPSTTQCVPFCPKCLESATKLFDLSEQVKILKKSISELIFIFSLDILNRRGKIADVNKCMELDCNYEKEVSESFVGTSYNYSTSTHAPAHITTASLQSEQTFPTEDNDDNKSRIDPLGTHQYPEDEMNALRSEIEIEEVKVESNQQDWRDECFEFEQINIINTECSSLKNVSGSSISSARIDSYNPSVSPIIKLEKLKFHNNGDKATIVATNSNYNGNSNDNSYTVGIKSSPGCSYRIADQKYTPNELRNEVQKSLFLTDNELVRTSTQSIYPILEESLQLTKKLGYPQTSKSRSIKTSQSFFRSNINGQRKLKKGSNPSSTNNFNGTQKKYECSLCGRKFYLQRFLLRHLKSHGEKPNYNCDICGKIFQHNCDLVIHKRIHTGEKPFHCDLCDYSFSQSGSLERHKRVHTGEKPFHCDQCDFSFAQHSNLLAHKTVHTGKKPYHCDQCDYSSARPSRLEQHKRVHTGEKPFHCDQCDYSFSQSGSLQQHKRVHTGEKPYHCDQCDYSSAQSRQLASHKKVHTGERTFHCGQCDYSSALQRNLDQHMKTHSDVKSYKCTICELFFKTRTTAIRHFKSVHFALEFSDNMIIKCA